MELGLVSVSSWAITCLETTKGPEQKRQKQNCSTIEIGVKMNTLLHKIMAVCKNSP